MVAAGDVWEGHELLRELERGMVRTFLARRVGDTGSLVSLHLRESARIEPAVFASEMQSLREIARQIPEIVPVCDGGIVDGVAWATSPVRDDAVPVIAAMRGSELGPQLLQLVIDIGSCLVRAHGLSAIHGALGPDRVLLAGDGRPVITHFGFVRLFQLGAEEALRAPRYAPPELLSGGRVGPRADVYGFGTVLYELLCQRELFSEEDQQAVSGEPWVSRIPAAMPPVLQWMMKRALTEKPRGRQPSVEQVLAFLIPFARAWEELGGPPETPDADVLSEPSASGRKRRAAAPLLVEVEDEAEPLASGETKGWAGELSSPRPSVPPDTLKTGMGPQNDVTTIEAPPGVPSVVPRSPSALDLPDLALTPPAPPVAPLPPPSGELPASPGGRARRRIPVRPLGGVLVLVSLVAAGWALVVGPRSPPSLGRLPRSVLVAAVPSGAPPVRASSDSEEVPFNPAPPAAPQPQFNESRQTVFARLRASTPVEANLQPVLEKRYYLRAAKTAF